MYQKHQETCYKVSFSRGAVHKENPQIRDLFHAFQHCPAYRALLYHILTFISSNTTYYTTVRCAYIAHMCIMQDLKMANYRFPTEKYNSGLPGEIFEGGMWKSILPKREKNELYLRNQIWKPEYFGMHILQ